MLGHVIDTGDSQRDSMVRLYKTSANIDYHCDAADVVGLLCLNKAREGGQSRNVSSVSVFSELLEPGMYLDMDLLPGDIRLLSNHTNLHARTHYVDYEEPERRRHLLRLWLSL